MESLPAVYMIFTLLNAFRRGIPRQNIWQEFRRQGIALRPRLSFWLALCIEAHLLMDINAPRVTPQQCGVTGFAPQWLAMPPDAQAIHLLEAWQNAPKNREERRFRRKLLWKLQWDKTLTHKDLRSLKGLEALGLCQGAQLTAWGKRLIKGESSFPTSPPAQPWQIEGEHLVAPIPQQTSLLWDLETYLRPCQPGKYPLTRPALLPAVNQGSREDLIDILERGLKQPLPSEIRARILEQPTLQILDGAVIEFSHSADLEALRRNPNLRLHFERVLSPRHVFLSAKDAPAVLRLLARRGIQLVSHQEPPPVQRKRTHFYRTPTPIPKGRQVPILQLLERHIQLQQALDILYRAPGYQTEKRRITPLLIEQRGEYTYIQAYCQNRRANRTFRLDRMEIPGTY
jgi:hypothetical protein